MSKKQWFDQLTSDQLRLWRLAETAQEPATIQSIEDGAEQAKTNLFGALAQQMSGAPAETVLEALEGIPRPEVDDLEIWWKVECTIAALREKIRDSVDEYAVDSDELQSIQSSEHNIDLNTLIAGRGYLALGLSALQTNQQLLAKDYFETSLSKMRSLQSDVGIATALTELGKLHAWRSEPEQAIRCLLESLSIWQSIDASKAFATWHEIGALLLDMGQWNAAASILRRSDRERPNARTKNALTRSLIGARDFAAAFQAASDVLDAERENSQSDGGLSGYRAAMVYRDLGEIACRADPGAIDGLLSAEFYLNKAIAALCEQTPQSRPIFTRWMHQLEHQNSQKEKIDFGHFRLMQLETLIFMSNDPEGAAVNFDKLADIYANRNEAFHEIECRQDAVRAFQKAGKDNLAVRQASIAVRTATENNLGTLGERVRGVLFDTLQDVLEPVFLVPGYLYDTVLPRSSDFHVTFSARSVLNGKPVIVHRISISAAAGASENLKSLDQLAMLNRGRRIHPGLTSLLSVTRPTENTPYATLIMEHVEGLTLSDRKSEFYEDAQASLRLARDLCLALVPLHRARVSGVRINERTIVLEHGGYPVIVGWPVPVSTEVAPEDDLKQIAFLLVDLLTNGRGAPERTGITRFLAIPIRGVKWDPLLHAKADRSLSGLSEVLTNLLHEQRKSDINTAQQFADTLEQYLT